jgi:hypothetical protein
MLSPAFWANAPVETRTVTAATIDKFNNFFTKNPYMN